MAGDSGRRGEAASVTTAGGSVRGCLGGGQRQGQLDLLSGKSQAEDVQAEGKEDLGEVEGGTQEKKAMKCKTEKMPGHQVSQRINAGE